MTSSSDGLIALCAKRINELHAAFAKLSKMPGPKGDTGDVGPAGRDGKDGARGDIGPAGKDGARGDIGPAGRDGKDGARGPAGPRGPAGKDGERGPMPDHEWSGTKLRFQKPDGEWGKFVQLRGSKGEKGAAGASGGGFYGGTGGESSNWNPDSLPVADSVVPTEFIVKQSGVWVRASLTQVVGWIGTDINVDGGRSDSVYLADQIVDGGNANG